MDVRERQDQYRTENKSGCYWDVMRRYRLSWHRHARKNRNENVEVDDGNKED